ncbi:MAG: histidine phosphatase family protein [Nitrospirae bacterium]|nr:histidine phosphatase family protein [Nitrospirota bacterium]
MVTILYLIRHGETAGGGTKRYKGSLDEPLSGRGVAQIREASAFIAKKAELSAVYCSGLSRALKSAEIIAEPYGLKPVIIDDLRERSFGLWEGMTFDEIKELYPAEFEAWASNPLTHSPVNGENTLEVYDRTIRALDLIINKHNASGGHSGTDSIAIVAHGGVNRIILCHLMGVPLENFFRIEQDYAAVNIIEFWERYPVIKLLNGGPVG